MGRVIKNVISCLSVVHVQEVLHVYLNKFEIAIFDLFLIIFINNKLRLVNMISKNTQSPRKWLLTLFADLKQSMKMSSQSLSVSKCCLKQNVQNRSLTISLKGGSGWVGSGIH